MDSEVSICTTRCTRFPSGFVRVRGELPWMVAAHRSAASSRATPGTSAVVVIEDSPGAPGTDNTTSNSFGPSSVRQSNSSLRPPAPHRPRRSDANGFREQLAAFSNGVVQYLVSHRPHRPPPLRD